MHTRQLPGICHRGTSACCHTGSGEVSIQAPHNVLQVTVRPLRGLPVPERRRSSAAHEATGPDGRWLVYTAAVTPGSEDDLDVLAIPVEGETTPITLAGGPGREAEEDSQPRR